LPIGNAFVKAAHLTLPKRIAAKLNLVAVLAGLALCVLSLAALHVAHEISSSATQIRRQALDGVVASAELGVLVERHRRIIEGTLQPRRQARGGGIAALDADRAAAASIADRVRAITASNEHRLLKSIRRQLPDLFHRAGKALEPSASPEAAQSALADYAVIAKRVQDRIVTYREINLRQVNMYADDLTRAANRLVDWILIATFFTVAFVGPLTIFAVRRIAERLDHITRTMHALSHDDVDTPIPSTGDADEIGEMARAIAVFKANAIALRATSKEIAALNVRLDIALNNMVRGLSMFDAQGRLIVANSTCGAMYGLPAALMTAGTPFRDIVLFWARANLSQPTEELEEGIDAWLAEHARKVTEGKEFREIRRLADGRIHAVNTKPLEAGGWVDVHEDITETQRSSERIADLARKDTLTGVANRHSFLEELHATCAERQIGPAFALFWIDLDRFKEVNDTYGHPAGDALLQTIAQRLKASVRGVDFVARLGGDEFAILIRGDGLSHEILSRIAQRLTDIISRPVDVLGNVVRVGSSIGISAAPFGDRSSEEIMKTADIALYRAKSSGRGRAVFFSPEMESDLIMRRRLQADLESAVASETLELHYQPIYSLATRAVVSFEALMRWHHPEYGHIPPAQFIPLAEECGLIDDMGAWALRTACKAAAGWPDGIGVSVNLSAAQFIGTDVSAVTRGALEAAGLAPQRLQLEVTEALLLDDRLETWNTLGVLKQLGVSIALDDFGTGYSSLSYLRSFPFDKIKIDRSFVREECRNAEALPIIRALTTLAQTLGIKAVAEGVETAEHLHFIEQCGCDEVQGYLFSLPVPLDHVSETLTAFTSLRAVA
jgi:diguanylate cyclase (GGDEF)-like protein